MRTATTVILAAATVGLAGCGGAGSPAASRPGPPVPVTVSAFVSSGAVRVAPARLGGGPVLLTVVNQATGPVALVVARRGTSGAIARTAPINPGGVTQVKVDLAPGTYAVTALADGHRSDAARTRARADAASTVLRVGRERTGGGGQVLQP